MTIIAEEARTQAEEVTIMAEKAQSAAQEQVKLAAKALEDCKNGN